MFTKRNRASRRAKLAMNPHALRMHTRVLSESIIVAPLREPYVYILKWFWEALRPRWEFVVRSFWIMAEWIVMTVVVTVVV